MDSAPMPRLLIVDDDPALLRALCSTLSDHGYECTGCDSGDKALKVLEAQEFALMMTDLSMPGMDGITALQAAWRRDPMLAGIVLTGAGTIATAVEAMRVGAFDYILKPFKLQTTLPVISRALATRQLRIDKAELERRVHERTEALEAANRELAAMNEELRSFSRSVSHDLRNPVHGVIGLSGLLLNPLGPPLDAQARHFVEQIEHAARRMNELIDDLMRLSQVSQRPLVREEVDLSGLASEIMVALQRQAPARQVEIRVERGLCVDGDPGLLRIALENLLGNAWKYTARVARPHIEFAAIADGAGFVVRDNGAGLDMSRAQRLFEPFQRFHADAEFEGSGIGLSIVHRIVQRHGGNLWAEAAVGRGASFYFSLRPTS